MTVDLNNIVDAYNDITSASTGGFDLEGIQMRYEMMDIDFDDLRMFLMRRLEALNENQELDEQWQKGYIDAAIEFFLYGNLTGKEAALDMEIELNGN